MKKLLGVALLAVCIAVGTIGNPLKNGLTVRNNGRDRQYAILDGLDVLRVKDIGILSVPPPQYLSFFVERLLYVVCGQTSGYLIGRIWTDNYISNIDLPEWLIDIQGIRNLVVEIFDRYPSLECGCSSASEILEIGKKSIGRNFVVFVGNGNNRAALEAYDGAQLLSIVKLGFLGDSPLFINKKQCKSIGDEQKASEQGNSASPSHQITIKLIFGVLCVFAGIGVVLCSVWHGVFSEQAMPVALLGLLIGGAILIYGLSNIF